MGTVQEFLSWESTSRDTIDIKKIYIDVVDDLVAGVLLSQIIYWFLPGKNGKSRLSQQYKDKLCLAKNRNDWWDECRITEKQYDRAIKILIQLELVVVKTSKWNGNPAHFIWLDTEKLWERVKTILPKGEYQDYPKGNNDIDQRGITYNNTETTTETTTKITTKSPPNPPEGKHALSPLALSWNQTCKGLPHVKESSKKRHAKESIRITERSLEEWKLVFEKIEASDFCKGAGKEGWRATYDWIIHSPDNAIKVLEGKYDNLLKMKGINNENTQGRHTGLAEKNYWEGVEETFGVKKGTD